MKALLILTLLAIGCHDLGVEPEPKPDGAWSQVTNFRSARSGWLNFISIEAYVEGLPDSMKIIVHDDHDAAYTTGRLLGGAGSIYARFELTPGYVSALPFELHLSVYVYRRFAP